ncbi:hypothetical protein ACIPWE_38420 [Streptomyces sp. NPDC090073]|uniref:hypothetical protein n=1 Tax=Streptomyces sp. NPDC090073 TaxID=3365936 RepID=UPI003813B612
MSATTWPPPAPSADDIAELEAAVVAAYERPHADRTRASYEASLAAGYIDRTFLEAS